MNFTNAELLKARERKMARFSPKFNNEGDGKKRGGAENQAEGAQAPKRRKLVKVSSAAGSSNPGAQPPNAAASKGKKVAKAYTATTTESTTIPVPNLATADAATAVAAKSTTVGATAASADATTTSGDQSPAADTTATISQTSAVEKLVAFNAAAAEAERLRAENAKHQEDTVGWKKRFDKLLEQAGKEKVQADKLIGTAGIKIGELENDLELMREEADGLDASLQACKKEKAQVEKDLVARSEALAAKESQLDALRVELESVRKALAEQEKKYAESLASARADLEVAVRTASEEIKKADEVHGAALAAKDSDITSHLAKIKELEGELVMEKAKATEAREQAADIAYDNRERGFYLAKDQAQHLFPNLDFSAMGVMKEITAEGLATGKKRGDVENQAEGAQVPKRRRLVKGFSASSSNPGAQPTAAAASSKSPTDGTSKLPAAEASAAAATEPVTVTALNSAAAGTATGAAAKSATIGATTTNTDQSSTAGISAAAAATCSNAAAGEKGRETEKENPKSPPRQVTPPSPHPTNDERSLSPPPRQEERPSPDAATTSEAAQIEQAPGNRGGSSSHFNMLPNAIEPSEFLLTGLNRDVIEKEVLSRGINETKEKTLACLLRAWCIFAHAFDNFNSAVAEAERIGELEDHLKLMKEEADDLDASLQACKKEKDQVEKDLAAKGEALAAKELELETFGVELELAKKALAEQEKKSAESLALVKADLEAMRATSEEIKKANEAHEATLVMKDAEITSLLARIKELEGELSVEKAKATEAREQAADIAYDNRERGFYLAKDQAQHLFPNLDCSAMGAMKEITAEGLPLPPSVMHFPVISIYKQHFAIVLISPLNTL
ncbi:uncharacterized protein LOC130743597 [Lotus japonicus]|uniref:uncharacterized protein LOC130743597 n=1 Tax=Lotus japonicus TaxID=34305 RepID=UPI00258ABCFC|nr:uncharacterized protein LOC130743597 [Lotus japonicus]